MIHLFQKNSLLIKARMEGGVCNRVIPVFLNESRSYLPERSNTY
jgi:hypothetical protein